MFDGRPKVGRDSESDSQLANCETPTAPSIDGAWHSVAYLRLNRGWLEPFGQLMRGWTVDGTSYAAGPESRMWANVRQRAVLIGATVTMRDPSDVRNSVARLNL
jgi:hypothetical protein